MRVKGWVMAESGDFDRASAAHGLREAVAFYSRKAAVLSRERERVAEELARLDAELAAAQVRRESLTEALAEIAADAGEESAVKAGRPVGVARPGASPRRRLVTREVPLVGRGMR